MALTAAPIPESPPVPPSPFQIGIPEMVLWEDGCAEPEIADLLCALLRASGHRTVLETGAFTGYTTTKLAWTLEQMGGGRVVACDMDAGRAANVQAALERCAIPTVSWEVMASDVLVVIAGLADESVGFVFVDDDHTKAHVAEEIRALLPKMAPRGIICFHDVYGVTDLQEVVLAAGGYALDLPKLGPAGGLGIIQVL